MVSDRIKATLTLAFITPVLTELFSANMGPGEVLNPVGFFLQFLAYSVPVLFIREIAARCRVGLPGLFLMGLAYSLFNEGIIAKTLFTGPPGGGMEAYDGFTLGRVHVVWAVIITTWHALHAVVFPIALAGALFPRVREMSWLNTPTRVIFLVIWVPAGVLGFLKLNPEHAHWDYFGGFLLAMAVLLILGAMLPARTCFFAKGESGRPRQLWLGAAVYAVVIVGYFVASEVGAPRAVLAAWPYGAMTLLYLYLHRRRWVTYVPVAFLALGDYTAGSFLNMLFQLDRIPLPKDKVITLTLMFGAFALAIGLALRRPHDADTGST